MLNQIQIIVLILMFPIAGFSQNSFSIGANVNTQFSFMTIPDAHNSGGLMEKGGMGVGYSIGIQARLDLSKRAFLRSGINYQDRSNRHLIEGLIFASNGLGIISSVQNDIVMKSLGVPMDFGFCIKSKNDKINYIIGFGGVINVNLETKTKAKILHEQIADESLNQAENKVDESIFTLGIFGGIEVALSERTALGIEPNLRWTPNNFELYLFGTEASTVETGITLCIRRK